MTTATTNILFVSPDYRQHAGCNVSLLSLLSALKQEFTPLVATPATGHFAKQLADQQIETIDFQLNNWWYPDRNHFFRHAAGFRDRINQLTTIIRDRRVALVHTNAEYAFEGPLAAASGGVPHVWNIRQIFGSDLDVLRYFPLSDQSLGEFMEEFSDVIVPNSTKLIETFPSTIRREIFQVIPSGLRLYEPPNREAARVELRRNLQLPDDAYIVISVGRISPEKDLETFIETARLTLSEQSNKDVYFVHFGPVYDKQYFAKLNTMSHDMANHCFFAGPTESPLLALRGADIFLFTSIEEGLARVCMEALLMELPVVSTRCIGPEEYLIHGQTALLAAPHDAATLARHVLRHLGHPREADNLARTGNQLIRQRYNEDLVNEKWGALYRKVLSKGRTCNSGHLQGELIVNMISLTGQIGTMSEENRKRLDDIDFLDLVRMLPKAIARRWRKIRLRGK